MDDFLHNLRTNNPKAFDRNRRNFDGNRFKPTDRQNQKDKRNPQTQQRPPFGAEQIAMLKKAVEMLAEAATKQAAAQERIVEAEERKAAALETLAANMGRMFGALHIPPAPLPETLATVPVFNTPEPMPPSPVMEDREAVDRQALMDRINQLRDNGTSYERIAQIFEEDNVQTLSGRGKWRGQTIFRLFKESQEPEMAGASE